MGKKNFEDILNFGRGIFIVLIFKGKMEEELNVPVIGRVSFLSILRSHSRPNGSKDRIN